MNIAIFSPEHGGGCELAQLIQNCDGVTGVRLLREATLPQHCRRWSLALVTTSDAKRIGKKSPKPFEDAALGIMGNT